MTYYVSVILKYLSYIKHGYYPNIIYVKCFRMFCINWIKFNFKPIYLYKTVITKCNFIKCQKKFCRPIAMRHPS